jgi:ADP-heptose:LPS heptosyltransferase
MYVTRLTGSREYGQRSTMNVSTLRGIDRYVNLPLCLALTLYRRLCDRRQPASRSSKIVFIKLAEQGSTVLAWGAIENAVRRVGRDHVYFLVFEENRSILDAVGWIPPANIIAVRTTGILESAASCLRALRMLRAAKVDTAIDLEFFARGSAVLAYGSGASARVGFHPYAGAARYRGDLLTHRVPYTPYVHTAQAFESLVDALDEPPEALPARGRRVAAARVPPPWRADLSRATSVSSMLASLGIRSRPLVVLNANASDLIWQRRWPAAHYVELARRLLHTDPNLNIVFTGATAETNDAQRLVEEIQSPRCVSVAGRTSVADLLALYTMADVLITNDSGPAHFASLTPIDVVTLFGPETPDLFGGLSPHTHVISAELACSPCLNAFNNRMTACADNQCMKRISVDTVLEKAIEIIRKRRRVTADSPTPRSAS